MNVEKIIVLDFGSQYNQLIARRIRDLGVYSEMLPHHLTVLDIKKMNNVKGIILSGGPDSVYSNNALSFDEEILTLGIPILGICYGMQISTVKLGGRVEEANTREYGSTEIKHSSSSLLFANVPETSVVWMSHGDQVAKLPEGFNVVASSNTCLYAAIENSKDNIYLVQFHPEVRNSQYGIQMLKNFVFDICQAIPNWSMENYINDEINRIKNLVAGEKVVCGLSGGVDSSVAAVLIHKAIGDNLTCVFVDHGLLRKDERKQVIDTFVNNFNIDVRVVDASKRFLDKLKGVTNPEEKRKIIGNEFVQVFTDETKKLGDYAFLAQGTLYTDIIESGTKTAHTIKTHHNVGGLPKDMKFKLLEPLKTLFKDEVRELGRKLGISEEIVSRQPFPGPGLAIRIIGEVTENKLAILREADYILREEIKKANLDKDIWQYFTVLTNIQTVGVMGDKRTYDYTVGIRAVTSIDGMTADWAKIPHDILGNISRRIINEVNGVNRVVYDITSKPPATIEWE